VWKGDRVDGTGSRLTVGGFFLRERRFAAARFLEKNRLKGGGRVRGNKSAEGCRDDPRAVD